MVKTHYTLNNKGASRYHRRTFLSKWFHKESLTSEESFCFTVLWRKKVLQIIKSKKEMFFKEPLTQWFYVEPKMVLLWLHCKNTFIFKHVESFHSTKVLFLWKKCIFLLRTFHWKVLWGTENVENPYTFKSIRP